MGNGGGVLGQAGDVILINSTVSGNAAAGAGADGGYGGGVVARDSPSGASRLTMSIMGTKNTGFSAGGRRLYRRSLSSSKTMGRPLIEHSVSIEQLRSFSNSRPCTKGVARASAAQAAENASPPSIRT